MECKFHSLETFFSSEFSAEYRVHHRLFVDFYSHPTGQREYTRWCTHPPLLIFFRAIPAPRHSGCCSASLPTHHSHFIGARLDLLATTATYGAVASFEQFRVVEVVHT